MLLGTKTECTKSENRNDRLDFFWSRGGPGGPRGSGEFGAFSRFRGESGRGEALSGSFLGREGPQKSTPYPGFKLEFKKTHLKSKNAT